MPHDLLTKNGRIPEWRTLEGKAVPVDAPDCITVIGRLVSSAEVSINVAAVPSNAGGTHMEIYGRDGALTMRANGNFNIGPSEVRAGKGKEPMAMMPVPSKYVVTPASTPTGGAYNVAQAYAADALRGNGTFDVDFDLAVQRHTLIDAIERSSATG